MVEIYNLLRFILHYGYFIIFFFIILFLRPPPLHLRLVLRPFISVSSSAPSSPSRPPPLHLRLVLRPFISVSSSAPSSPSRPPWKQFRESSVNYLRRPRRHFAGRSSPEIVIDSLIFSLVYRRAKLDSKGNPGGVLPLRDRDK